MEWSTTPSLRAKLRRVRLLIEDPAHWDRWEVKNQYGLPVPPHSQQAVKFTLAGALRRVEPTNEEAWEAICRMITQMYGGTAEGQGLVWQFNAEAMHAQVLEMLDAAIAVSEQFEMASL